MANILPSFDLSISDSLHTYGIISEGEQRINEFLTPVLSAFMTTISKPPLGEAKKAATPCAICDRDGVKDAVKMTQRNLIPSSMHDELRKTKSGSEQIGGGRWPVS